MPIFPRYGGVSTGIPTENLGSIGAPEDPRPRQIEQLGRAGEAAVTTIGQAQQRRQMLEDEAAAMQRYMQAVTDMEGIHETLNVPENALQAKDLFAKGYNERQSEWFKGLNGNASAILQKKLFPKSLEYKVGAAKLENRAKLEDYNATMVRAETWYADAESRRIDPSDGSTSSEYRDYAQMVDTGVGAGYITPQKGAEMKDAALKHGAYSRAYKVTVSDSQAEIKNLQEIYKKEEENPGSTFLKNMDPDKRVSTKKMLDERLQSLEAHEQQQKRQARQETQEMNAELSKATATMAQQKLANPEKYGALTTEWVDLAADLRLLDDKDVRMFYGEINAKAVSGTPTGYDDPVAFQRYAVSVYDTRSPEQAVQVRDALKADIAAGKITTKQGSIWMNHLEEKTKATGDTSMSRQSNDVKDIIKTKLRSTGPAAQTVKPIENSVISEALEKIDRNAAAGYPENPWAIYDREINGWQARVGVPASIRSVEQRRSLGLPPRDAKSSDDTIEQERQRLSEQFKSAPPGPEGEAIRNGIRERARRLKGLQELEQSMQEQRENVQKSKSSKEQQSSGSAPQLGPRR